MSTKINEISVRERGRNAGGSVVATYYGPDADRLDGKGAALLLVHGFNDSREAAMHSFATFVDGLEHSTMRDSLPWPIFGLQWPGDEENAIASALCYPLKIAVARRAAAQFIEFLRHLFGPEGKPIILYVVSHSLGGRIVAEVLANLILQHPQLNVVVNRVTLMAAAVPTSRVDSDGDLRRGIDSTGGVCVLHSKGDAVLHYAFPIGQTVGGDGFFPTAVGRAGHPSSAWRRSVPMSNGQRAYGHSSYWPGPEAAAEVAAFFGVPVSAATPVNSLADRELPPANSIAERQIPTRDGPQL